MLQTKHYPERHPEHACFLQFQFERCQQQHAQNTGEDPCSDMLFGTDIVKSVIGSIGR
jgi:hypothetical protein